MIKHYKTYDNTYLCMPMIKANPQKMTMCFGDVNCEKCKEKYDKYMDMFFKAQINKSPKKDFRQIKLSDVI